MDVLPRNRGRNTSLVAALGTTGIGAALTIVGAIDRPVFVRDILLSSLRPGQRVVWDTLRVHRHGTVRMLLEAAGCTLHPLPASSPDCNPIALACSKRKTTLRRTGARTRHGLDEAISAALPQQSAADAIAWIAHCGYGQSGQLL